MILMETNDSYEELFAPPPGEDIWQYLEMLHCDSW